MIVSCIVGEKKKRVHIFRILYMVIPHFIYEKVIDNNHFESLQVIEDTKK